MGPIPTYYLPKREESETMDYLSGRNPLQGTARGNGSLVKTWESPFVSARDIGQWVGEQRPLGKTPPGAAPVPK